MCDQQLRHMWFFDRDPRAHLLRGVMLYTWFALIIEYSERNGRAEKSSMLCLKAFSHVEQGRIDQKELLGNKGTC